MLCNVAKSKKYIDRGRFFRPGIFVGLRRFHTKVSSKIQTYVEHTRYCRSGKFDHCTTLEHKVQDYKRLILPFLPIRTPLTLHEIIEN